MKNIVEWLVQFKVKSDTFHSAAKKVGNDLDQIKRKADKANSSIGDAFSGKNFKQALSSLPVIGSLMNPYVAAITGISAGLTAIVRVGSQAQITAKAFEVLVGNEREAADILKEIKELAKFTPYKTMDLIGNAKMMLNFGVSTKDTVDMLKRLGDIAQSNTEWLSGMTLAYSQVVSQGRMEGQDYKQFINAGFNPLTILSEMTGESMAQLKERMSKGQIGGKAITEAIKYATDPGGKFHDMSKDTAETISGKWSTFMGQVEEGLDKLFKYIEPTLNWLLEVTPPFFDWLVKEISNVITYFQNWKKDFEPLVVLWGKIWEIYKTIESRTYVFLKWIFKNTFDFVGKLAKWLSKLFGIETPKLEGSSSKNTVTKANENKKKVEPAKKGKYGKELWETTKGGKGANGKDANAIATGGTRNTTINMTIGKFFDTMQVTMMDATDTTELETIVVQSLNRALAIATSTDR